MSLGASDLPLPSSSASSASSVSSAPGAAFRSGGGGALAPGAPLRPFDYASARGELNEARECKLRADALLRRFASGAAGTGALSTLPATAAAAAAAAAATRRLDPPTTAERMRREVDRRIALVSRTMDARKGRPYHPSSRSSRSLRSSASASASAASPSASAFSASGAAAASSSASARAQRYEKKEEAAAARQRRSGYGGGAPRRTVAEVSDGAGTEAGSPVTKMLRTRRRTSIRPAELSGIRTVPKAEVPVVRSTRRRRKVKQATPVVVDKRKPKRRAQPRPAADSDRRTARVYGPGSTSRHLVMLAAEEDAREDKGGDSAEQRDQTTSSSRPWRNTPVDPPPSHRFKRSERVEAFPAAGAAAQGREASAAAEVHAPTARAADGPEMPATFTTTNDNNDRLVASAPSSAPAPPTGTTTTAVLPNDVSAIVRAAMQGHYRENERRLIEAEARERASAEALRLMQAQAQSEAAARQQREEELMAAREHADHMVMAIQAIKEANTSLEVTNSALAEQVDKVHDRARAAEMDSLRQFQARLNREEIEHGLHVARARDLAEDLPFERLCLDLVTELVMQNLQQPEGPGEQGRVPAQDYFPTAAASRLQQQQQEEGQAEVAGDNDDDDDDDENSGGYSEEEFEEAEGGDEAKGGSGAGGDASSIVIDEDVPAEEVGEEGFAAAASVRSRVPAQQQQPISQFVTSSSPSSPHTSRQIMSQFLEEKSRREKAEQALVHIREKETLALKLRDAEHVISAQRDNHAAAERYQDAVARAQRVEEHLEREMALRKEMEKKLEQLRMAAQHQSKLSKLSITPSSVPAAAPVAGNNETSLGALLRKAPPVMQGDTHGSGGLVPEASKDREPVAPSSREGFVTNVIDVEIAAAKDTELAEKQSTAMLPAPILIDVRGAQMQNKDASINYNSMLSDYSSGSLGNLSGLSTDEHSTSGMSKDGLSSGSGSLFNDTYGDSTLGAGGKYDPGHLPDVSEVFSGDDSLLDEDDTADMSSFGILNVSSNNNNNNNAVGRGSRNSPPKMARSATALLGELGVQDELLGLIVGDLP